MNEVNKSVKKARIVWIDIAKAIGIIAMIEGHTVAYGGYARAMIYSFHMPLFFFIAGFTIRPVTSFHELCESTKKDLIRLYLPCIVTQAINGLLSYWVYNEAAEDSIDLRLTQILWGSAIDVYGYSCLGMLWFLVALFWARFLYQMIFLIFPSKCNAVVFLLFAAIGKLLSLYEKYLPQSWDVVFVAVLFIYMGYVFRKAYPIFEKYQLQITAVAFLIWTACWEKGIFMELGGRWYPYFALGILEAFCGCICVFTLSNALENCKIVARILKNIGKHTMLILCMSHLDWFTLSIWGNRPIWLTMILRPALAFAGAFVIAGFVWQVHDIISSMAES